VLGATLLLALAGPQLLRTQPAQGIDSAHLAFAVDVSASMGLLDLLPPDSLERLRHQDAEGFVRGGGLDSLGRLGVAKQALRTLMHSAGPVEVALVAYDGAPRLLCPLTPDTSWIWAAAHALRVGAVGTPGTSLLPALAQARASLGAQAEGGAIVLLSDGADSDPSVTAQVLVAALDSGAKSASRPASGVGKVRVHTIAVGQPSVRPLWHPFADEQGKWQWEPHLTQPQELADEALLRELAATTRGTFCRATNAAEMEQCAQALAQSERLRGQERQVTVRVPVQRFLLGLALLGFLVQLVVWIRRGGPWS
jgi:hypothetical protein